MKSTRKIALAAVAAVALYAVIRSNGGGPDASDRGEDPSLLLDRVWVDTQPEKLTDYVQASYFASQQKLGVFQKASAYDYRFELFKWKRDGKNVELTFPQTGKSAKVSFTIKACDDLPPFDLCLDLSQNPWGGPKRYHGMREQDDEAAKLGAMRDALRARAESAGSLP
jgi:hypothetical protein